MTVDRLPVGPPLPAPVAPSPPGALPAWVKLYAATDGVPVEVYVQRCPVCHTLVEPDRMQLHQDWHRTLLRPRRI